MKYIVYLLLFGKLISCNNNNQVVKYDALNKEYSDKISAVAQDATLSKETQKERKNGFKKRERSKAF